MSLVALDGTPLVMIGGTSRDEPQIISALVTYATLDSVKEALLFVGQVFTEDGASHTINTTGSSALEWRTGAVTFANGSTTVLVGLAALDLANGPPARAANSSGAITFDVSKTMAGGGGGITANAWQAHVPDSGSKTIANGDFVAFGIQMTARGGADSVIVQGEGLLTAPVMPAAVGFDGTSTYTALQGTPNAVITFSDGTLGFFFGGFVATTGLTTQTWNSSSGTKEYGNFFQMPVPAKVYGFALNFAAGGDSDLVLYSDPLGTPVAQKTLSIDANAIAVNSQTRRFITMFASPYSATANQPLAGIMKPTTATNVSASYKTFNSSAHQKSETLGTNCYAVNRNTGAFAAQNSNKDRFAIGLLVGAFDNAVSAVPAQLINSQALIG